MLTSPKNPKIATALRLHKRAFRDEDRAFLVEGAQGIGEALSGGVPLRALYVVDELDPVAIRAAQAGVTVLHVADDVMHRLTSTVTPQGSVAVAPFIDTELTSIPADGCTVVLHEVRDPGNAGTVIRSADAAGAGAIVFTEASADVYNEKTIRASAGSVFHVPIVRDVPTIPTMTHLRGQGVRVLAMDPAAPRDLYSTDLTAPIAFVFGNEAHGLPQEVIAAADATVRVPHAGRAESLNLAAAATVCLFEWARRRSRAGDALETLIAAAAHDIRSPLTAMKGFGYALERRWEQMTEEQRALMLGGIVHDADRMDTILRHLVDAARVVAGSLELFPEQTDLSEVVVAIDQAQRRDPEHPEVTWSGDAGPFMVDPARIRTAILAFVESLVWWGSEGPIAVTAEREANGLHLAADRAGADLMGTEPEALFAPRRPGTGGGSKIGLYVTRQVVAAQGGRTWAEIEGGRLTFHLSLPLPH